VTRSVYPEVAALLESCGVRGRLAVFGSRARGTGRPGSDLDLLIDAGAPLPVSVLARFEAALSDSTIPFAVDLVDAHRVDPGFLQAIRPELVSWDEFVVDAGTKPI
jgi:predicted nucleotidyltransferase